MTTKQQISDLGPGFLMKIAEDLSATRTDVSWMRDRAEEDRAMRIASDAAVAKRLDKLEGRQDKAEADARATRAWAAGAAAAMAFLATALKDWVVPVLKGLLATLVITSAVAFASLAGGCVANPLPSPIGVAAPWDRDATVLIDERMSNECLLAADSAPGFWADQGVDYLDVRFVPEIPSRCPDGHICIEQADIVAEGHEGAAGGTYRYVTTRWDGPPRLVMRRAHIILVECDELVAAHELGHALGLVDLYSWGDITNVMFWVAEGGDQVNDEQRKIVTR